MRRVISAVPWLILCLVWLSQPASAQGRQRSGDLRQEFQASLTAMPDAATLAVRGSVYVAAYSNIRTGNRQTRIDLSTTLSIHNTSDQKPLVIEKIDYFDTAGTLIERYLDAPVAIRPFGTIEVFIAADDNRGGTGANFVVSFAGAGPIAEPLVETVMIGTVGTTSYSFVSQGRTIRTAGAGR
jgi:hypothetical protein